MRYTGPARFMKSLWDGKRVSDMAVTELLAPVPAAADYSVSIELWQSLENEIKSVSARIEAGDELVPEDVSNVRKLKAQVDKYVTDFNKAMRDAQAGYRKMVDRRLTELGFDNIEQFIAKKRQEQTVVQDSRIAYKMECLKTISDGLLERTKKLKDMPIAKELLPAFTARFPKIQSGAKSNEVTDWKPYFAVVQHVITVMDTFFCDPKYEDAVLLPLHSGTMRELLAFAKDGKEEHLASVIVRFKEDGPYIRNEKLRQSLKSKADGIGRIRDILKDLDEMDGMSEGAVKIRTEQAWEEISLIVRLVNSQ